MKNKIVGNRLIIASLALVFIGYNLIIYTQKSSPTSTSIMSEKAIEGEILWQQNNCTACHQFYGLGGYLGPDLTNVISHPNKGEQYVKAFVNSGVKSMPKFNFSEKEKEALTAFLTAVDKTGYYPNNNAKINPNGWVEIEYKR